MPAWYFTPYQLPLVVAVILAAALAVYAWRSRTTPGAAGFIAMTGGTAVWSFGYILELSAPDLATKILMSKIPGVGIVVVPLAWAVFAIGFTGRGHWVTPRRLALAMIMPVLTLLLHWSNELHGLMFSSASLQLGWDIPTLRLEFGPWFWLHSAYSYLLLLSGSVLLLRRAWQRRSVYRWQALLTVSAVLIPWAANAVSIFRLLPTPIDLTTFSFAIACLIFGWDIFRYKFLNLVPVAHEKLFTTMADSVIVIDAQRRVVELNPAAAALLQVRMNDVIGADVAAAFPHWRAHIEGLLTRGQDREELEVMTRAGERRWFDVHLIPLTGSGDQPLGQFCVLRDITTRKQAELALAQAHQDVVHAYQFKTQLFSKITHDLRTPLTAIRGYGELLTLGVYGELAAPQLNVVERIVESTEYLDHLVSDLLDQARLDAGQLVLEHKPFLLLDLIARVTPMRILAEAKGLAFEVEVDPTLPQMLVSDLNRVQQILINLIGNAIKFTETGCIQVSFFRAAAGQWGASVTDSGAGIPLASQAAIFEPFRQLGSADGGGQKGFGLGLSIVRDLTAALQGEIRLDSQPGVGSTFTVLLPLIVETEEVR